MGLPNLYAVIASLLPGLDAIRVPGALACGVSLALVVLSGFGAAALLRLFPTRLSTSLAVLLVGGVVRSRARRRKGIRRSRPWQLSGRWRSAALV